MGVRGQYPRANLIHGRWERTDKYPLDKAGMRSVGFSCPRRSNLLLPMVVSSSVTLSYLSFSFSFSHSFYSLIFISWDRLTDKAVSEFNLSLTRTKSFLRLCFQGIQMKPVFMIT